LPHGKKKELRIPRFANGCMNTRIARGEALLYSFGWHSGRSTAYQRRKSSE